MPTITFQGQTITCAPGTRLRTALHQAGLTPHNGTTTWFNCKGLGTCGTCAVEVEGELPPPGLRERLRLSFPPHRLDHGLRLACKIRVNSDLVITKHPGFWGHLVPR